MLKSFYGRVKYYKNLRYTNYERLLQTKSCDDIWGRAETKEPNEV
jgi:hypothetical protein